MQALVKLTPQPRILPLDFQVREKGKVVDALRRKQGVILIAPTGSGKTYYILPEIKAAQDEGLIAGNDARFASVLILTKKSVKIQTQRVVKLAGVEGSIVESYDALRSSFGEAVFINWVSGYIRGVLDIRPQWIDDQKPDLIWCDECQTVKNPNSLAGKIILAATDAGIPIVFSSATPFVKISEAEVVVKALSKTYRTEQNWRIFASDISGAKRPDELNHAAMGRLNSFLEAENLVIKFRDIKYKHRTINHCKIVPFEKPEHRAIYNRAYNDYLDTLVKANKHTPEGMGAVFAAMTKFREKAEILRSGILAKTAVDSLAKGDYQVIIASNFVGTLRSVWTKLTELEMDKDKISFIVGSQKQMERQLMIDKFQKGINPILLTTLKAGGVGISLHHELDLPAVKPRLVLLPPTWSAIELVQMLGRAHRITSLSTTHQYVIWFEGTIEEEVAARVEEKMRCLKEIVTKKETWTDLFTKRAAINVETVQEMDRKLVEDQTERDEDNDEVEYVALDAIEVESVIEKESQEIEILPDDNILFKWEDYYNTEDSLIETTL